MASVRLGLRQQLQPPHVHLVAKVELLAEADVHVGADQQVAPRRRQPDSTGHKVPPLGPANSVPECIARFDISSGVLIYVHYLLLYLDTVDVCFGSF